jgi:hypothetical protein
LHESNDLNSDAVDAGKDPSECPDQGGCFNPFSCASFTT